MLADKILLLLRYPYMAADLGGAGRKSAEEAFSLKQMIQEYQLLYENSQQVQCQGSREKANI